MFLSSRTIISSYDNNLGCMFVLSYHIFQSRMSGFWFDANFSFLTSLSPFCLSPASPNPPCSPRPVLVSPPRLAQLKDYLSHQLSSLAEFISPAAQHHPSPGQTPHPSLTLPTQPHPSFPVPHPLPSHTSPHSLIYVFSA